MGDYINRLILWCKVGFSGCHLAIHKQPKPLPLSSNHKHDQGAWIDYKETSARSLWSQTTIQVKSENSMIWYESCVYWMMMAAWKWIHLVAQWCRITADDLVWHNLHWASGVHTTDVTHIEEEPLMYWDAARQARIDHVLASWQASEITPEIYCVYKLGFV